MRTLVQIGFQRNSTTQTVYLTSAEKQKSAELSIQTYASAELILWFCVVDFCWFNGCPKDFCWFFSRQNSTSQNVLLSSADVGFFSAEIHKSGDAWLPIDPLLHFHFLMWNLTCTSCNGTKTDLGSWLWGPWCFQTRSTFVWPWKWINASCSRGHQECEKYLLSTWNMYAEQDIHSYTKITDIDVYPWNINVSRCMLNFGIIVVHYLCDYTMLCFHVDSFSIL